MTITTSPASFTSLDADPDLRAAEAALAAAGLRAIPVARCPDPACPRCRPEPRRRRRAAEDARAA